MDGRAGPWRATVPPVLRRPIRWAGDLIDDRRVAQACAPIVRALAQDPAEVEWEDLVGRLADAWGNPGWSARAAYLRRVWKGARRARRGILECGSGLTTLVAHAATATSGTPVVSLEPLRRWRIRVGRALAAAGLHPKGVMAAPLRDHGDYDWYDVSAVPAALSFDLVICDGPPGSTSGGRYGLLPVMRPRLSDDVRVLLDDADRAGERGALERWRTDFGVMWETVPTGPGDAFAVVRLGPSAFDRGSGTDSTPC